MAKTKKREDGPALGFIIVDYKPRQHETYESARNERDRLQSENPQSKFLIMRVLNASKEQIDAYNKISALLEQAQGQETEAA